MASDVKIHKHYNIPDTMGWVMLSTEVPLQTLPTAPGSVYFGYVKNLVSNIKPPQTAVARFDPNTHIRRRDPVRNTEVHRVELPDIRYINEPIRNLASADYHLDHTSRRAVNNFTWFKKHIPFGPEYFMQYFYILYQYLITVRSRTYRTFYSYESIGFHLWKRLSRILPIDKAVGPVALPPVDGGKYNSFDPSLRKPDKPPKTQFTQLAIAQPYTQKVWDLILKEDDVLAGIYAMPLMYDVSTDNYWDDFQYIAPIYRDRNIDMKNRTVRLK